MSSIPPEVPEADALEQAQPADLATVAPPPAVLDFEVPEADALDQAREVPLDYDDH